jgi:hypothetical protein
MKKNNIIIICLIILSITSSKGESLQRDTTKFRYFNNDTSRYLNSTFINNKSLFFGFPLLKLLQKLEIKPQYFLSGHSKSKDSVYSITLYLLPRHVNNSNLYNYTKIKNYKFVLYFKDAIDRKELDTTIDLNGGNHWSKILERYFKNKIISEFIMMEY